MGWPVRFIANGGGCASLRNGRKTRQIGFTVGRVCPLAQDFGGLGQMTASTRQN
jgi:hypothetical protein